MKDIARVVFPANLIVNVLTQLLKYWCDVNIGSNALFLGTSKFRLAAYLLNATETMVVWKQFLTYINFSRYIINLGHMFHNQLKEMYNIMLKKMFV